MVGKHGMTWLAACSYHVDTPRYTGVLSRHAALWPFAVLPDPAHRRVLPGMQFSRMPWSKLGLPGVSRRERDRPADREDRPPHDRSVRALAPVDGGNGCR
ncbi:hypothetical protein [Salinisphaera sp. LB1]|uniref:hypothetical protein n=1 Tax=Salinisphaera sp. LB1 TaxID=2183911 RepID=UPI0011AB6C4A|nr:hypothetical protein [Salinisphaera sp. LB1]